VRTLALAEAALATLVVAFAGWAALAERRARRQRA
jgi:hypothetical protein